MCAFIVVAVFYFSCYYFVVSCAVVSQIEKRAWKLEMGYGNGNVNKYVQLAIECLRSGFYFSYFIANASLWGSLFATKKGRASKR